VSKVRNPIVFQITLQTVRIPNTLVLPVRKEIFSKAYSSSLGLITLNTLKWMDFIYFVYTLQQLTLQCE
jgi:hypothetical protein